MPAKQLKASFLPDEGRLNPEAKSETLALTVNMVGILNVVVAQPVARLQQNTPNLAIGRSATIPALKRGKYDRRLVYRIKLVQAQVGETK